MIQALAENLLVLIEILALIIINWAIMKNYNKTV